MPSARDSNLRRARKVIKAKKAGETDIPKDNTRIGLLSDREKDLKREQSIATKVQKAVLDLISSYEDDPEGLAAFLKSLPPNSMAQIVTQYIPKQKDVDADLAASHISLTKSFEKLPHVADLSAHLTVLSNELRFLRSAYDGQKNTIEQLTQLRKSDPRVEVQRVLNILRDLYIILNTAVKDYFSGRKARFITEAEYMEVVNNALGKD